MKIPDSIRIGGVEYPISYVDNLRRDNLIAYGFMTTATLSYLQQTERDITSGARSCGTRSCTASKTMLGLSLRMKKKL